jgi:hypothetical protein
MPRKKPEAKTTVEVSVGLKKIRLSVMTITVHTFTKRGRFYDGKIALTVKGIRSLKAGNALVKSAAICKLTVRAGRKSLVRVKGYFVMSQPVVNRKRELLTELQFRPVLEMALP